MPYTDDNLNELFQKAAEDYPLNTDNSDWNSIAGRLQSPAIEVVARSKNKSTLKYALLLLLLLGGSLTLYKFQFLSDGVKTDKSGVAANKDSKSTLSDKTKSHLPDNNTTVLNSGKSENQTQTNSNGIESKKLTALTNLNHSSSSAAWKQKSTKQEITSNNLPTVPGKNSGNPLQESTVQNLNTLQQTNKSLSEKSSIKKQKSQSLANNSVDNKTASSKQSISLKNLEYRFYGSLYASPDFSTVKFQHFTKPGINVGVSLGYRINNKFSIELGLQRKKINVYSDGKYFNADNIRLKPETSIENLRASSKTTSVPLALRYNISSTNKGQFFVTAGMNAVLITHNEKYDYAISRDGSEDNLSRKYSSVTDPKYFTGVNFSAGYETKLINWCNLKIEPYYQAPIRKFGIGELPVSSVGINIGIVKNLK